MSDKYLPLMDRVTGACKQHFISNPSKSFKATEAKFTRSKKLFSPAYKLDDGMRVVRSRSMFCVREFVCVCESVLALFT